MTNIPKSFSRKRAKPLDKPPTDVLYYMCQPGKAVRQAIAAGEHMRAWITQDTEDGEIELARREMPLADYMAAIADDISWYAAPHAE